MSKKTDPESQVREIRRRTRHRFSSEAKIRISSAFVVATWLSRRRAFSTPAVSKKSWVPLTY